MPELLRPGFAGQNSVSQKRTIRSSSDELPKIPFVSPGATAAAAGRENRRRSNVLLGGSPFRGWLEADAHGPAAFLPLDVEGAGLSNKIAEFRMTVRTWVEIRGEVGEPLTDPAEPDPTVFVIHLGDDFAQER